MKIRLNFFDRAYSGVMDVPEDTGLTFKLVLTQPRQLAVREIPAFPEVRTVCEFEWSGYYDGDNMGITGGVKMYRLVGISKW